LTPVPVYFWIALATRPQNAEGSRAAAALAPRRSFSAGSHGKIALFHSKFILFPKFMKDFSKLNFFLSYMRARIQKMTIIAICEQQLWSNI